MSKQPQKSVGWLVGLALITVAMVSSTGCLGLAANLGHALFGNLRPAEYKELSHARVAVLVVSEEGIGADPNCRTLSMFISELLARNLKKAKLVPQEEIEQYLTKHGSTDVDFVDVGRAVKADRVLVVTMENLSLRDGATLFRGSSDLDIAVYDIADGGKVAYRKQMLEFSFPTVGGTPISDTSESRFRTLYLNHIANRVSNLFYDIEATSDFALDATTNRL